MEKPVYPIKATTNGLWYEFESISDQRITKKAVAFYVDFKDPNLVELVFGDLKTDGSIDVKVGSKNKDMIPILTTVVQTVYYFFTLYPSKSITFMGSTMARNRLYRMLISKILADQSDYFQVFGQTFEANFEPFESNKDYFSYKICLKQ